MPRALTFLGACIALSVVGAAPAAGQNTLPDSYCPKVPVFDSWESDTEVWRVDNDVNTRIGDATISDTDVENTVDLILQNMVRHGRAAARTRVLSAQAECSIDDAAPEPCIEARLDSENDTCNSHPEYVGFAFNEGVFTDNQNILICQTHGITFPGNFERVIAHELGHAYGLKHVAPTGVNSCFATTGNCSQSDGCDGELMCNADGCQASVFVTAGDAAGLQAHFPQKPQRRVFFEVDNINSGLDPFAAWVGLGTSSYSLFPPRIDCSDNAGATNKCIIAYGKRTSSSAQVDLFTLSGFAGGVFSSKVLARSISVASVFPPDVAVSPDGTVAWILYVPPNSSMRITRVPLGGGATATVVPPTSLGVVPVLAPRIAFAPNGELLVLAVVPGAGVPRWSISSVSIAENPTWVMRDFAGTPDLDGTPLNGAGADGRMVTSDYDFDCSPVGTTAECTVVANLSQSTSHPITRSRSISFTVTALDNFAYIMEDWDTSPYAANGVIGVAKTASQLFVAQSYPVLSGTNPANTRVDRYSGRRVSSPVIDGFLANADAEVCDSAAPHTGSLLPPATMHGGVSIGFCPSCSASGTLQSVGWGRPNDLSTYCH